METEPDADKMNKNIYSEKNCKNQSVMHCLYTSIFIFSTSKGEFSFSVRTCKINHPFSFFDIDKLCIAFSIKCLYRKWNIVALV